MHNSHVTPEYFHELMVLAQTQLGNNHKKYDDYVIDVLVAMLSDLGYEKGCNIILDTRLAHKRQDNILHVNRFV